MSQQKQVAEAALLIWSGVLGALKADGLIATCIEQTGANTTRFMQMLALDNVMKEAHVTWIPVAIIPNPGVEVFVIDEGNPDWPGDLCKWNGTVNLWLNRNNVPPRGATHYMIIPPRANDRKLTDEQ